MPRVTGTLTQIATGLPIVNVADVAGAQTAADLSEAVAAIPDATASVKGLATAAQVSKLDGIAAGAQVNLAVGTTAGTVAAGDDSRLGTVQVHLPSGATVAASGITRANKVASGSGVQSLVPGATTVPAAADVAAGLALLRSSVFWGSSLAATRTETGNRYTQAELVAMSPGYEITVVAANGIDGTSTAALLLPSTTDPAPVGHQLTLASTGITVGHRARIEGLWKPSAIVTGQAQSLTVYFQGTSSQVTLTSTEGGFAKPTAPVGLTGCAVRNWKRADGWLQFSIEYTVTDPAVYLLPFNLISGKSFIGDGTTGIIVDQLRVSSIAATAVENLSDTGTATITRAAATAPLLETDYCPEDGWWPDGSQVFRFNGLAAKGLDFSAPAYEAISGTAVPVTMDLAFAPYQTEQADAALFSFTGATAVLKWEHTTADKFKLTRTTDTGATTTVTFDSIVGHVPAIYSVALDGTSALLYRQGLLVETAAFSLAGVTTFTAGAFGSAASIRVAEIGLHDSALTAIEVWQLHCAIASSRSIRLEKVPLWFKVGQSNAWPGGNALRLPEFGSPARSTQALYYEPNIITGWTQVNSGWGPSRLYHLQDWADSPVVFNGSNSDGVGSQFAYGSEAALHEILGFVATAGFSVGGVSITTFIAGGVNNAAMLAAFDDAVATIGVPYYFAGVIYVGGETDAQAVGSASAFAANLTLLLSQLNTRYGDVDHPNPKLVAYRLHRDFLVHSDYQFTGLVRSQCNLLRDSNIDCAVATVDEYGMKSDWVHLGGTEPADTDLTLYQLGLSWAEAARNLGA